MATSRQYLVRWKAGASWPVLKPPKPTRAKPSLRGSASAAPAADASEVTKGKLMAVRAPQRMNLRREIVGVFIGLSLLQPTSGRNRFMLSGRPDAAQLPLLAIALAVVISSR